LVFSELNKRSNYYLRSDLGIYDLQTGKTRFLTDSGRARDPDVSADGKWVAFTQIDGESVSIKIAPLLHSDDEWRLGDIRTLVSEMPWDVASTPKFSRDGKRIVFSLHRNGEFKEGLYEADVATGKTRQLVDNGAFNRFPAFNAKGELFYVSDLSGTDNIYRLGTKPEQVSNTTTAFWLPAFASNGDVYASELTYEGWSLAKLKLAQSPIRTQEVSFKIQDAPPSDQDSVSHVKLSDAAQQTIENYSIFPSIWPRQWSPILAGTSDETIFGGEVLGFDATDRHRYVLGAIYDTLVKSPDLIGVYSNRQLGATLTAFYYDRTTDTIHQPGGSAFLRTRTAKGSVSFPFQYTYSLLEPSLSFNLDREYSVDPKHVLSSPVRLSPYVPSSDAALTYTNVETSQLAIGPERGRTATVGVRKYLSSSVDNWKVFASDTEHFPITAHSVLTPSLRGSMVNHVSRVLQDANVNVNGRNNRVFTLGSDFGVADLDGLDLRGYPNETFVARSAVVGSLDYQFPIGRIFRGWGTNPVFLNNFYGFAFGESAYFPTADVALPSTGGGLTLTSDLFIHIPLSVTLEYDYGFREAFGGKGELIFTVGMRGLTI
jgi:hypothetical protein